MRAAGTARPCVRPHRGGRGQALWPAGDVSPIGPCTQKQNEPSGRETHTPVPREKDSAGRCLHLPTEVGRGAWGPRGVGVDGPLPELSGLSFPVQKPSGTSSSAKSL